MTNAIIIINNSYINDAIPFLLLSNCPPTCHAYTRTRAARRPGIFPHFYKAISKGHLEKVITAAC
jgi:hypothetical protein